MVRARPRQHKLETFTRIYHKHQSLYSDNIHIWIDKLLDVRELYHEAELLVQDQDGRHSDEQFVRKVDASTSRLEFQLPADEEFGGLIFKVADDYVAVRLHGITIENHGSNLLLERWTSNADVIENDLFIFCNDNPTLQFNLSKDDTFAGTGGKLVILLDYLAFGRDCLPILLDVLQGKKEIPVDVTQQEIQYNDPAASKVPDSWWSVNKALIKLRLKSFKYYLFNKHYRTIKKSDLFDPCFYRQNDSQMNPLLVDPLIHYVEAGWREGRNPNPLFEVDWYRRTYQVAADQDPLLYYIEKGWRQGDKPDPLFFTSWYVTTFSGSIKKGTTPLADYLKEGWHKKRNPNPLFDSEYYRRGNSDVVAAGDNPFIHYLNYGRFEGRNPSPFFHIPFYKEDNPSVVKSGICPLLHYFNFGAEEGRSPNRFFDPEFYKTAYHLTGLSRSELFVHFVEQGSRKYYRPSALFDPESYSKLYPESLVEYSHPLLHYQEQGVFIGNFPCREIVDLPRKPTISLLTPVYNTDEHLLRRCIHSVLYQAYPHWELCLVDDGSSVPHIQPLLEEYAAMDQRIKVRFIRENQGIAGATNEAAKLAVGEYVGFLDHDDELTADALYEMVLAINEQDPDILYSDEDLINNESRYLDSFFKPDLNSELLLCHNYITHFLVSKRSLYDEVGGLSSDFNGAQDYDLLLKLTEKSSRVHHIPKVLYHWRATETSTSINHAQKDYANEAGLQALQAAVRRRGLQADVRQGVMNYYYELHRYPSGKPLVDIFVLLENGGDEVETWLTNLLQLTRYENYRVYLIPCAPLSSHAEEQLKKVDSRVMVMPQASGDNLALALNSAVQAANGEFLCFVDQGVQPKKSDWLESFLGYAQGKNTGVVGGLVTKGDGEQEECFLPDITDNSTLAYHHFLTQASAHANGLFCPQEVVAVSSEFCMVSRKLFIQAGEFDDVMFSTLLYDVDLCFQLHKLDLHHLFTPYCSAIQGRESIRLQNRLSGNDREKAQFQKKWQPVLMTGNPYYSYSRIQHKTAIDSCDWLNWYAGPKNGQFTDEE
jgi:glycosyltransferase involved in cell wall biosynthesis